MKNYTSVLLQLSILFFLNTIVAQSPQKISYQATLRNNTGNLIVSSPVGMRISILSGSINGTPVYVETHSTATNQNGLISIEIGNGTVTTGVFSNITWGANSYFIKTEVDPTGGASYTISGTTQMLSVPYALYAENTKNLGKTTIILSGDITNAAAASLIAAQAGPNTEEIKITNTTNLTSLDLSQITSLISFFAVNNSALTSINIPNLKTVYESLSITDNINLNSFNAPLLESSPSLEFTNNALISISFPAFKRTTPLFSGGGSVSFSENNLTSISFPQVTHINDFRTNSPNLSSLTLNTLTSCGLMIVENSKLTNLQLSNLTNITSGSYIRTNSLLTNINLASLTTAGFIAIMNNMSLTNLNLSTLNNCSSFDFSNNKLSSTRINAFLNQLLSIAPASGKNIDFRGQNPPAPPIGQGIIDKTTLINTGNTVFTD